MALESPKCALIDFLLHVLPNSKSKKVLRSQIEERAHLAAIGCNGF